MCTVSCIGQICWNYCYILAFVKRSRYFIIVFFLFVLINVCVHCMWFVCDLQKNVCSETDNAFWYGSSPEEVLRRPIPITLMAFRYQCLAHEIIAVPL